MKSISSDVFFEKYTVMQNPIYENAPYDGTMLETYGAELELVKSYAENEDPLVRRRVWTILEEDGKTWISAGYHYVNRLGYLITREPYEDIEEAYLDWDENELN